MRLTLCKEMVLTFDSVAAPTSFSYTVSGGSPGSAALMAGEHRSLLASSWSQGESGSVLRVLGEGPWHIDWPHLSKQPWAFLWGGVLAGPKELASYEVVEGSDQLRIRIPPGVVTKGTVYSVTMTGGAAAAAAAAVVAVVL